MSASPRSDTESSAVPSAASRRIALPNVRRRWHQRPAPKPGTSPGLSHDDAMKPPAAGAIPIQLTIYDADRYEVHACDTLEEAAERLHAAGIPCQSELHAGPTPPLRAWLRIDGLHRHHVQEVAVAMGLHTLSAEDVLNVPQRPKAELYDDHVFAVARLVNPATYGSQQLSMVMSSRLLVTFLEQPTVIWPRIDERLAKPGGRLRTRGTDYLMYVLLDAAVDSQGAALHHFAEKLDGHEAVALEDDSPERLAAVHRIRHELTMLRREIDALQHAIDALIDHDGDAFAPETLVYLRDVRDHALQAADRCAGLRDFASGLVDLLISAASYRMNRVMQVLTVMATLFIPTTFLAGVYGMNFAHIPELQWRYAYPVFWLVCLLISAVLLLYFRRIGWLGRRRSTDMKSGSRRDVR